MKIWLNVGEALSTQASAATPPRPRVNAASCTTFASTAGARFV